MAEQRKLYRDRDGVRRTMIWDDESTDRVTVRTEQDLEPILDGIARDRELHSAKGGDKLAARLPLIVVEDLILRDIFYDETRFKAWLNSSEAAPFRIWKGRL